MAEGLNRIMLIGNLGAEPEVRFTQSNRAVLKFRIATTEKWVSDGEKKEQTTWHSCVLWGNRAEPLAKLLTKGMRVYVEGRQENRSYEDKDGQKRMASEVNVTEVVLLDGRREGGATRPANGGKPAPAKRGDAHEDGFRAGADDSEIPF